MLSPSSIGSRFLAMLPSLVPIPIHSFSVLHAEQHRKLLGGSVSDSVASHTYVATCRQRYSEVYISQRICSILGSLVSGGDAHCTALPLLYWWSASDYVACMAYIHVHVAVYRQRYDVCGWVPHGPRCVMSENHSILKSMRW